MSLDPPTYLNSLQNNIRARPIPWEGAVRAGTITDKDLKKIKAVDKVRKDQRRQTVEAEPDAYRSLIIGGDQEKSVLDSASRRADVVQYMLVLTGDLLNGSSVAHHEYPGLTIMSRCPVSTFSPPAIPRPLQAIPASPQQFDQPRRPDTAAYFRRPDKPFIKRANRVS